MILVFAKSPEVGRVKTRLGKSLGMERAVEIHLELLERTLKLVSNDTLNATLYLDGDPNLPELQDLMALYPMPMREQDNGDLGIKMFNAFERELQSHPWVIIVGSDCPVMDVVYINNAIAALETSDVVIGPAEDGGYVLIGARRIHSRIFSDIQWGESNVLKDTCDRLAEVELTYELLSTLWDVDYVADWRRWQDSMKD